MPAWFGSMGPLGWPLALCSVLALALVLERLGVFLRLVPLSQKKLLRTVAACQACYAENSAEKNVRNTANIIQDSPCSKRSSTLAGWRYGVALLQQHRQLMAEQREEVLTCWLQEERGRLIKNLRILQMIGMLAPMLGLLGTVLGMVTMFAGIAEQNTAVTPAVLADGLWQALYTTVWGMLIAIPALAAGQGFSLWAERYLERVQVLLNRCQLALSGLAIELPGKTTAEFDPGLNWSGA